MLRPSTFQINELVSLLQLQLLQASSTFQINELVSLLQTDLHNVVEKALVQDVTPIIAVASYYNLSLLKEHGVKRVTHSCFQDLWLERELFHDLQLKVRLACELEADTAATELPSEKTTERIYRAPYGGDINLLCGLLNESTMTLDRVYGLHYANNYCHPKVVSKILECCAAIVNLRNSRGYAVLHTAARLKDPTLLVTLLSKGACALDCTLDGKKSTVNLLWYD